jgi:hypothetical protein
MSVEIQLFAGSVSLGTINAEIIDASMGVVGGVLKPTEVYFTQYQSFFQAHLEEPSWKGLEALNLKARSLLTGQLTADGGIDITDFTNEVDINEIEASVCGISYQQMSALFPAI